MCTSCVGQGVLYLGGALAGLKVMAHRAGRRPARVGAAAADVAAMDPRHAAEGTGSAPAER